MDATEYVTRRKKRTMTKEEQADARDLCQRWIGTKTLCGLRQKNKVRFFIATTTVGSGPTEPAAVVDEVTSIIARLLNLTRDKDGWICRLNAGYDPRDFIVDAYYEVMGQPKQRYVSL